MKNKKINLKDKVNNPNKIKLKLQIYNKEEDNQKNKKYK